MSSDEVTSKSPTATEPRSGPRPARFLWWITVLSFVAPLLFLNRQDAGLLRELAERVRLTRADFAMAAMFLVPQYTRHRTRTGAWPRPAEIRKEFPLLESRDEGRADGRRIDIYRASTPGVTIQFRLGRDGDLAIRVVVVPLESWRGPTNPR